MAMQSQKPIIPVYIKKRKTLFSRLVLAVGEPVYISNSKILTREETQRLFELLEEAPMKWRMFFTLDIYTGMRRGELLGLEWKDIDFTTGLIHIERTSNYTKDRGIYTDTPRQKARCGT